ncbi:MAG: extracellular matrix/biofilm biosynthesis regulator RemA family protein [bacterium]
MYIKVSSERVVAVSDVVALINVDGLSEGSVNDDFLNINSRSGRVIGSSGARGAKSFVVLRNGEVHLSPFRTSTLIDRL